jgi:transposase
MAFPSQKQECFLAGHVAAFHFFGGIPWRLTYDNLKTAVKKIFIGHEREEQASFIVFRSHYLFESHYCNPRAGHDTPSGAPKGEGAGGRWGGICAAELYDAVVESG